MRLRQLVLAGSITFVLALAVAACTQPVPTPTATATPVSPTPTATATPVSPTPTTTPTPVRPTPTPTPDPFAGVSGIIDPANHGWPREVEGLNGRVTIAAKPSRIHTVSLGHDEITYALVPAERVVAVGKFTQNPEHSNVAELAQRVEGIGRDPEQIVVQNPDIVIASPFAKEDLLKALENVGIPVVQTELHNDPEGRIQDILFLGYVYGEEERALALAAEVRARYDALTAVTQAKLVASRPQVISIASYSDKIYAAGLGSTEGSIIEAAGGINTAAEAGLVRNPTTSLEGIIAMRPDVIILPQPPESGGKQFKERLLNDAALDEVPAVKEGRIYLVPPRFFTTLSFWNIRGAEELAKILWPEDFDAKEFPPFSFPQ